MCRSLTRPRHHGISQGGTPLQVGAHCTVLIGFGTTGVSVHLFSYGTVVICLQISWAIGLNFIKLSTDSFASVVAIKVRVNRKKIYVLYFFRLGTGYCSIRYRYV